MGEGEGYGGPKGQLWGGFAWLKVQNSGFETRETFGLLTKAGVIQVLCVWVLVCVRPQGIGRRDESVGLQTGVGGHLLELEVDLPAHQAYEHLHLLEPVHHRREGASILTSNFVTRGAFLPPTKSCGIVELLNPALLAEVAHSMVDGDGLPEGDIPVSEQAPLALTINKPSFRLLYQGKV